MTVLITAWILLGIGIFGLYFNVGYGIFQIVKAKDPENYRALSSWRKLGLILTLPLLSFSMTCIHLLTKEIGSKNGSRKG